ncbi:hypothetical protein [Streptomyces sp. NPDC088847]|uniref:hypothetical protein n=1 Tax=Streptomyces sp. NPDC088847 TaxID=3365909 RepID=UPI003828E50E
MQENLESDRAAFKSFFDGIPKKWSTRSVRNTASDFMKLDHYRRLPLGWGQNNSIEWDEFRKLQDTEQELRKKLSRRLGELAGGSMGDLSTEKVRAVQKCLNGIRIQEREIFRARRAWGRALIERAKLVFDVGAANQILDIARSGGQSVDSTRDYVRNETFEKSNLRERSVYIGRMAAVAEHFGAGACSEQGAWVATEAYKMMPGTQVTLVADESVDHLYAILGPPGFPESAYVDPWPANPSVADVAMYGLKQKPESWAYFQGVADGRDLRAEGLKWLYPLPERPARRQPLDLRQAAEYVRGENAHSVYFITSTKEELNSDSDAEAVTGRGLVLSENAFTASVANGFRVQGPPQGRIASMRSVISVVPSASLKSVTRAAGISDQLMGSMDVAKSKKR